MRKSKRYLWMVCLLPLVLVRGLSAEEAAPAHQYIGVKKCKMCHLAQFKVWEGLKMAKAVDTLKAENNKKTNKDETQNPECLKCHTTGMGHGGYEVGKADPDLANVQCEACHGAGSDYQKMDVMKDKEKAKAAGLIIPDESVCKTCHTPEWDPDFDFTKYSAQIDHKKKQ